MTIVEFVNEVMPTNELSNATTINDVKRIVSNAPIDWEEQEFTQNEVTDEMWYNRGRYINVLKDAEIENMKGDFVCYMQDHNSCDFISSRKAIEKIAFRYANDDCGATYDKACELLAEHYDYLEQNEPDKLVPCL